MRVRKTTRSPSSVNRKLLYPETDTGFVILPKIHIILNKWLCTVYIEGENDATFGVKHSIVLKLAIINASFHDICHENCQYF